MGVIPIDADIVTWRLVQYWLDVLNYLDAGHEWPVSPEETRANALVDIVMYAGQQEFFAGMSL